MPSLASILNPGTPEIDAYNAAQELERRKGTAQIGQLTSLAALMQHLQAAEKAKAEQAFAERGRAAVAALPPNATEEQLLQAVRPFQGPNQIGQQITASRDRREATAQRAQQFMQTIDLKQSDLERKRDEFMSKTEDHRQRGMFEQWYKTETLKNTQARDAANAELKRLGIAVQQQGVDAQRERIAQGHQPIVQTDERGNTRLFDRQGNLVKNLGATGKPSAALQARETKKAQLATDISTVISELETATADKGLIDKSTGSGAGALVDIGAGFFGKATPGAIAVGQMKPIYDLVLKMVPRFEGPQSDKDTKLYMDASGQLANPAVPNEQKKAAGKEILRLMKARKNQFVSKDMVGTDADAKSSGGVKFLGFE